jgi:hypothetical protein
MTTPATNKGDMMPLLGQKGAPAKFRGHYAEVKRFTKHFNQLCTAYAVTDAAEKCSRVTDYCSSKVVKLIEALTSYQSKDWDALEKDLHSYYDAALKDTRYIVRDLLNLTRTWKARPIKTLTKWKQYQRKFTTIAGWLETKKKISEAEKFSYFWHGINKPLREVIEIRLITGANPLAVTEPFPIEKVCEVAKTLFERNRFDINLADSDTDIPGRNEEFDAESTDGSSADDESDSDNELRIKVKKLSKKIRRKKHPKYITDSEEEEPAKKVTKKSSDKKGATKKQAHDKKASATHNEVEDLIQQMSKLSLDDQRYGLLYYKALKLDPDIVHCVKAPQVQANLSNQNRSSNRPATSGTPNITPLPGTSASNNNREPSHCYGCGNKGHNMQSCFQVDNLIKTGVFIKQPNGRLAHADGTSIRRQTGETFVQAAERYQREKKNRAQSHFFALGDSQSDYYLSDADDDDDDEEVYVMPAFKHQLQNDDTYVMAAERTTRRIAEARKEVLDGVYPPSRKLKGKENTDPKVKVIPPVPTGPTKFGPAHVQAKRQPTPTVQPTPQTGVKLPTQFPVDVRTSKKVVLVPRNGNIDEDIRMKDGTNLKSQPKFISNKNVSSKDNLPVAGRPKPFLRQSEISSNIAEHQVVNQILDTPVTLRVREVLASSKELSDQVTEMLRRRNPKPTAALVAETQDLEDCTVNSVAVHQLTPMTKGQLLELRMECDGRPITAIIDTGSQLNVVSRKAWKSVICRPMDVQHVLTMNDANGGEGVLRGLVQNVPLSCGGVTTKANLFIGESPPFDLLLGRPWQRSNFVSIDERVDGTYLVFNHQGSVGHKFEIMVSADRPAVDLEYWKSKSNFALNPACEPLCAVLMDTPSNTRNILEGQLPHRNSDSFGGKSQIESYDSDCIPDPTGNESQCHNNKSQANEGINVINKITWTDKRLGKRKQSQEIEQKALTMTDEKSHIPIGGNNEHHKPINHHNGDLNLYKPPLEAKQEPHHPPMAHVFPPRDLYITNTNPLPPITPWLETGGYPNASFLINQAISDSDSDRPNSAKVSIVSSDGYRMNPVIDEAGIPSEQGILLNATIMVNRNDNSFPTALRTGHMIYQFFPFRISESGNVPVTSREFPQLIRCSVTANGGPDDGIPHVPSACQSFETTVGAMPELHRTMLRSCASRNGHDSKTTPNLTTVIEISDDEEERPRTEDESHSRVFYNHIKSIVSDSEAPEQFPDHLEYFQLQAAGSAPPAAPGIREPSLDSVYAPHLHSQTSAKRIVGSLHLPNAFLINPPPPQSPLTRTPSPCFGGPPDRFVSRFSTPATRLHPLVVPTEGTEAENGMPPPMDPDRTSSELGLNTSVLGIGIDSPTIANMVLHLNSNGYAPSHPLSHISPA